MATPKNGYYTKDGKRVPGTTTILGRFKDSGGLIHWSWQTAFDGLTQARALLERWQAGDQYFAQDAHRFMQQPLETWDYRVKRDKAANAGTVAHDMVECFVRGRPFDAAQYAPELVEAATPAYGAFREWAGQTKLESLETEVPLVSEKWRFGGTRDAILVNGKRALGDWKTSNAVYGEYLCQLAAYAILDEEHGNTIDGGFHLLRFSKQEQPDDPVHFTHHYWDQLDVARAAFLRMRELYDDMARLKKMAA